MWFKNKSKIFKILSLSLFTFPNLVFVGNFTKRNPISFYAKNDLINQNLSKHNQEQLQTINDWTTRFPWLEKYASDENFTNRNFNAYINQGLIENAIKDYYFLQLILSFESFILNNYPCLKYRYFKSSANDCKLKNAMVDDTSTDWVTSCMSLPNKSSSAFVEIIFDQDYFEQLNKTYWNYYFDIDKCEFNFNNSSDINPLVEDIRSCLFENEKSNGIYYVEEKDKDNKNNPINLEIRDKIKKIKDIKNTYCKEKLLFFCDTIKELRNCDFSQLTPSHIKKINELMLFLCKIASTNRELLDYSAIAKEKHEEKFAQSAFTSLIRQELSNWVKNYFNASIIPKEFLPFLAHNKFDDFLNYIYCYRKKYVCKGVTNFKNAIDDFIPSAVHNHKLIAWEKAIASFILTILNKKKTTCLSWFAPFTDGESFEHFAAEYFQWSINKINFLVLDGWWWYLGLGGLIDGLNIGNGIAKKVIKKIFDLGFKKITDAFNERIVNTLRRNSSAKNLRSLQRTIADVSKKGIMNATENNSGLLKLNKMHIEKEIANTTNNIINDFNNEVINGEQIINNQEMENCQVNNSEAISLATGEILRFFGHHYPTIEKCGQIFLINTYYFPEESYSLLPPNTPQVNSTLVENILRSRLKRQCESRKINLSDDKIATIISYCLKNYFKRPRINVRTINMDEIVHIPWSYGEDKGVLDEVDKFMNLYTIGCENKWLTDSFYWLRNKKCIDDTKNKITRILDLNKDNLIPIYYFNSNFWIHSKHVPKEVSQWIPINMIGEGFIPFKWLILSILKILKNDKNPLEINYLIKTIFSFFKIENTDKEIAPHILPVIKRIFREPTLQIHEKNNNFFCLKSSLPKKIIEAIKKWERIASTPTYSIFVNGQEYVSSSTIISSIVNMLISKKSIFTLQRAFLQKIVEFYFKQSIISYKNNIAKKQNIAANNTRQISINRSDVKNINKEKKAKDNESILPDRSNIIQNNENIPAYDNLISEDGYNINNIAQNEEKREKKEDEKSSESGDDNISNINNSVMEEKKIVMKEGKGNENDEDKNNIGNVNKAEANDINDNELEEYVKDNVNELLNNARFTINRQIGLGMMVEKEHDIIEYLFIGDSLSKELKDQIKKENEIVRNYNAGKSSMLMDGIDADTVNYHIVISLIIKLLSSKNKKISNEIEHNNNYRYKLSETIKNIVLKLIKKSWKISNDTYKIVINENDYDFVQEKKDEKNNIIQSKKNSVKNENEHFNDRLISEERNNINNISQEENRKNEKSNESGKNKNNIGNVNEIKANNINDELDEYIKNTVNGLLNNAEYQTHHEVNDPMDEFNQERVEYSFIAETLSEKLKNQIKKANNRIRIHNLNIEVYQREEKYFKEYIAKKNISDKFKQEEDWSEKKSEINSKEISCDELVSLIIELLSSENKTIEDKIEKTKDHKGDDNYRSKLLTMIKNIVLSLIESKSQLIVDNKYRIEIVELINGYFKNKNDEQAKDNLCLKNENIDFITNDNSIENPNEKVGEENDNFNDKKQVQVHRVDNDKDNKTYYTKLDHFNAIKIYEKFKKHSIFATKKDSLRIAYKERKDKEKISDSYKNLLFNGTFHNYIKRLLKEPDIIPDIDGLRFRFDSLPMLIKQKLKNLFPSAIRWDSLITEITKIVEEKVKCHIGDNFIKICLTEILNSKSWHSLVYKKDINTRKANIDAINKNIKKRIEAINNCEDNANGIYYSLINNDGYDPIGGHNMLKHVEKEINIDEIVKSIKEEYLQTHNSTEQIDLTRTKEIIEIIGDIFKENSPIIKFFNFYPDYNKYDNSDDKIGYSVAFFSTEHLPEDIQNNVKPKEVNSRIVAEKITELIEQKNNGEEKYAWFKHFKDAIAKDEIITDVLDVLYNRELQIDDKIVGFIIQSLAHIDVMKWSDVSTQNTDYWVRVDSLSSKEALIPSNFDFEEKCMIEIKNHKYIQFDVLVDRIIVALWNLYSFPIQKDNKPNLPHNVWFIGGERISLNKVSEAGKISKELLVTNRVKYICYILLWMFEQKHINENRHFEEDPNFDGGYKSFGKSFSFGLWNEDNFWSSYLKNKKAHKNDDFFSYIFSLYSREQEK